MRLLNAALLCGAQLALLSGSARGEEPIAPPSNPASEKRELDVADVPFSQLFADLVTAGENGGFGYRLQPLGARDAEGVFVHGFAITELLKSGDQPLAFELEFINLIVGARLSDQVLLEAQLEAQENGRKISFKYGLVDLTVVPHFFTLRVGKMLAPIGTFNEYLFPEYLNKMVFPPRSHLAIVPRGFTVVGLQARGKVEIGASNSVNYGLFIANNPLDEDAAPGGELTSFVSATNDAEVLSRKALGGRIGARLFDRIDVGFSGFLGNYGPHPDQRLIILDADASYTWGGLSARAEVLSAQKTFHEETVARTGFYAQLAYRFWHNRIEPALQYDMVSGFEEASENRRTVTAGVNFYPFDAKWFHLLCKLHGQAVFFDGGNELGLQVQLGIGF